MASRTDTEIRWISRDELSRAERREFARPELEWSDFRQEGDHLRRHIGWLVIAAWVTALAIEAVAAVAIF